ncbi:recombinase family protein [Acidiferrimicrobium sp. IK]|uniref:recombinase family protein n=1 Tax=Acidiferrimicrobium sp. IK TaxID=2871700 RepID=UPI0021CB5F1C|nr:recombinase family protein [Acidiferrimicrobium sp. IK]MCU4184939.1 recombinase family protein [Acidiferrimicrobium sp. IK]
MSIEAPTKVKATHLGRAAYLYVRQSTLRQVLNNTESTLRQYDLRRRAAALGWTAEQIIVVDVDQGHSGASAADREGFQRLVADVSMGRAGIVLGLECSRLARNNADWHRLLEICALTDTLICDEDGLYDPADFNDRMLLGLKGTLSEAELHFIRARLRGGQLSKARRGELPMILPVGLVYDPTGKTVLDPDAGVQQAIRHLFAVFARTGSARAVVQAFRSEGLRFPGRIRSGAHKGELSWTPLRHDRVLRVLHNPRYAGAFVYGRLRQRPGPGGRLRVERLPREQWTALIPDSHPGYITWDTFELNQKLLADNARAHGTERASGPAREGNALLQGLAVCGRCGCRMSVAYHLRAGVEVPDYRCMRAAIRDGVTPCTSISGKAIDAAIGQLLLDTVTPLALEVALTVQAELETRADEADALRKTHVERARHRAETARRRYLAVDPDNRLVADTLEADWNDALRQLREAQEDYERAATAACAAFTNEHKQRIRSLAADFPALWSDPATPQRERKRMARLLIEDVTIIRTDHIDLHVRFKGGQTTSLALPLPLTSWQARQTDPATLAELDRLLDDHTDAQAAELLNQTGHRSGTGQPFTPNIVLHLRRCNGLASHLERLRARGLLTITELADRLGVHPSTIKAWHHAGLLESHQANDKNIRLFDPPEPGDPRLIKRQGTPFRDRLPIPT